MKLGTQQFVQKALRVGLFFVMGIVVGGALLYVLMRLSLRGHVYPIARIGEVQIAGETRQGAVDKLNEAIAKKIIRLSYNEHVWELPSSIFSYNAEETVNRAYQLGRRFDLGDWAALVTRQKVAVRTNVTIDYSQLNAWLDQVTESVEIAPIVASVVVNKGVASVVNGSDGTLLNREDLFGKIENNAMTFDNEVIVITTRPITNSLSASEVDDLTNKATKLLTSRVVIEVDENKTTLEGEKLVTFLNTEPNAKDTWDQDKINNYSTLLAETYNRESENAKFEVIEGKVKEFAPGRDGVEVDVPKTSLLLSEALNKILGDEKVQKVAAEVRRTPPRVATGDVNKLGIEKRIGRGESYYAHSIPGRIFNVGLTAGKITGVLIAPGEEFSFNKTVGDISAATGFMPAYVIQNGRTVLGDGGGVCQVSTTVFRAAMAAGLPIVERWAHAYRVGYYEQNSEPGIDATIFNPSKDFRFLNNTPRHILVQAINDPKTLHLIIDIYGTDDGRVSEVSKVKVWGITAPPPNIYQDDPSLPLGVTKQVDWAAWGAKTTFDYKVTRNGETIFEKSFPSTYRAWQNVYLRGTHPTP